MRSIRLTRNLSLFALLAAFALSVPSVVADDKKEEGFTPIFNGKDFTGLEFALPKDADPVKTWSVQEGVLVCTGKPNGYFYTKKSYGNYVLRLDFKYPKNPGNSGYLIHIQPPHKVWPKCIEVQGQYNGVGDIFPIGGAKGARPKTDADARTKARKPNTEWNSLEIVSKDGMLTSTLNGVKIAESQAYELKEGPIGFQSEGAEIHFRNIRIKEMK